MSYKGRVIGVRNHDASNALGPAIGVECVGWSHQVVSGNMIRSLFAESDDVENWTRARASYIFLRRPVSDQALFFRLPSC